MLRFIALVLSLFLAIHHSRADVVAKWNQPVKPFRIAGNVYYVGTNYLASYLITTPQGDILINPDYAESVPLIEKSVAELGRKFTDIKIILISHAHDDHAAGCALAKKLSGARLMVMAQDVPEIETGGANDFAYHSRWQPAKVDRILHDGDRITLGGTTLVARLTPGHTKGCTTWTGDIRDNGKILHMVIVGSASFTESYRFIDNPKYPEITQDYEKTFRILHSLPCDLFLGAHGSYFDLDEKRRQMRPGAPNPFIDPAGYQAFVQQAEQQFENELARQRAQVSTATSPSKRSLQ